MEAAAERDERLADRQAHERLIARHLDKLFVHTDGVVSVEQLDEIPRLTVDVLSTH
ncbi:MAG: hypothetical protein M5U28_25850 [Sandaracinaceae bacterium]|nr:hypothetical protein [Sandaracinaceae bacterium]